jgi:hypothetical protein
MVEKRILEKHYQIAKEAKKRLKKKDPDNLVFREITPFEVWAIVQVFNEVKEEKKSKEEKKRKREQTDRMMADVGYFPGDCCD